MKTSILAGSFVATLALMAAPLHAQQVSAEVVLRDGPISGRVHVGDGYPSYQRQVSRVVVVERHSPRQVRVERFGHRHPRHWRHKGYRKVILYYVDGRYYDRWVRRGGRVREVVVYERNGRYYLFD
jgi:hypothetical protein